jgi:hypothetical protein
VHSSIDYDALKYLMYVIKLGVYCMPLRFQARDQHIIVRPVPLMTLCETGYLIKENALRSYAGPSTFLIKNTFVITTKKKSGAGVMYLFCKQ